MHHFSRLSINKLLNEYLVQYLEKNPTHGGKKHIPAIQSTSKHNDTSNKYSKKQSGHN